MVFALVESGMPIRQIAGQLDKNEKTISRWLQKTREFIKNSEFDIDNYRLPLHALYPLWLKSVMMNLKACDTTLTIAMGKGMQYFVEKQETHDANQSKSKPTDELEREIVEIIDSTEGPGRRKTG